MINKKQKIKAAQSTRVQHAINQKGVISLPRPFGKKIKSTKLIDQSSLKGAI